MHFWYTIALCLLVCWVHRCQARPHEPTCSQFDFQERLLEKAVRNEHKMGVFDGTLKEWETTIGNRLNGLKELERKLERKAEAFDELVKEKEQEFDTMLADSQKKQEAALNAETDMYSLSPTVVFLTNEVQDFDVDVGKVVRFTTVETNDGDAYDVSTGKFTAPMDGSYIFFTTVCSKASQWVRIRLKAAGRIIASTGNSYSGYGSCSSTGGMSVLSKGDQVWVEGAYSNTGAIYSSKTSSYPTFPSFSGMLIHAGSSLTGAV